MAEKTNKGFPGEVVRAARVFSLDNAVSHNGRAVPGAVVGKLLAAFPELKSRARELHELASDVCREINSLPPERQKELLEQENSGIIRKEKKERGLFDSLRIDHDEWDGKLVSAFPPEPSKYPHIGHAKAILLNYELAKAYKGRFILRFEDTNPALAKKEFYEIHRENYEWLGIVPDEIDYASDHMELFYGYAETLVKKGNAYICKCPLEKVRENRAKGSVCDCRERPSGEQLTDFKEMFSAEEGSMILRLKGDMAHKNSAMRDPALLRIIKKPHARKGGKYSVWPTYDFENAVMDGAEGVTHRLRSKEFELRNEVQRHIQRLLGLPETIIFEFGRFNMLGVESSGRVIREMIEKGELLGWDDPRLTTIVALRRRGFLSEAIKSFVLSTGITKAEAVQTWDDLIVHNKRLLDKRAERYFFVDDPVLARIEKAPQMEVKLRKHPENPSLGHRLFRTGKEFYLSRNDLEQLEEGKLYRLMGCLNFIKKRGKLVFDSLELEKFKKEGVMIMHWLPKTDRIAKTSVLMPDGKWKQGLAEEDALKLDVGVVIQFERFGFCRLDEKKKDELVFWFSHH